MEAQKAVEKLNKRPLVVVKLEARGIAYSDICSHFLPMNWVLKTNTGQYQELDRSTRATSQPAGTITGKPLMHMY